MAANEVPAHDDEANALNPTDTTDDVDADDLHDMEEFADWGGGELEAAYLKAMSALEASETAIPETESPKEVLVENHPTAFKERNESVEDSSVERRVSKPETEHESPKSAANQLTGNPPANALAGTSATTELPPTPRQIIEACLFVGGDALTANRLAGVLRGDFKSEFIDREIDELNRLYAAENRPYEIRLGDGGYRLALREEHERIRHKVYGLGPKEVRLSQEALEVLAVVAYHQPIKQSRVEELGKPACGAVLRQLVRRELLAVERDPATPRDVNYKTTPRFLSLFGIRNLDELPRHEQVSYK